MIAGLFQKFEQACYDYKNIECWSARELQEIFSYTEWRNFLKVIEKAKEACGNAGETVSNHFVDTNKMVDVGSGAQRGVQDIVLTRYACYLVAQNGDPAKPSVASAQTYFAVQTWRQEIIGQRLLDLARVAGQIKTRLPVAVIKDQPVLRRFIQYQLSNILSCIINIAVTYGVIVITWKMAYNHF